MSELTKKTEYKNPKITRDEKEAREYPYYKSRFEKEWYGALTSCRNCTFLGKSNDKSICSCRARQEDVRYSKLHDCKYWEQREKPNSYIYFIIDANKQYIKIGKARNPQIRLAQIQVDCPLDLELLGYILAWQEPEKAIQWKFESLNVRGEWFKYDSLIIDFLLELQEDSDMAYFILNDLVTEWFMKEDD